nr:hypothetical protein Iba_chr12bCG12660 [Ipomoea batatas]
MLKKPPPTSVVEKEGENRSSLDRCGEAAGRKECRCSPLGEIRRTVAAVVARVRAKLDETEVTGSRGGYSRRQAPLLRLSREVPLPPPIIIAYEPPPAHEKEGRTMPLTFVDTPYLPENLRGADPPVTAARRRKPLSFIDGEEEDVAEEQRTKIGEVKSCQCQAAPS